MRVDCGSEGASPDSQPVATGGGGAPEQIASSAGKTDPFRLQTMGEARSREPLGWHSGLPNIETAGNFRDPKTTLRRFFPRATSKLWFSQPEPLSASGSYARNTFVRQRSSWMSRFSVYWPEECGTAQGRSAQQSSTIPFPRSGRRLSVDPDYSGTTATKLDVISRARLLFTNRRCRHCLFPVVSPLQRDDAQLNRQGLEIPGTATIVGFRCDSCDAEWEA